MRKECLENLPLTRDTEAKTNQKKKTANNLPNEIVQIFGRTVFRMDSERTKLIRNYQERKL